MKPGQKAVIEISSLKPDDRNARSHDEKNVEAIAKSLSTFGQQKPIVVLPNGKVVAGNGTLEAAKKLGWSSIECWVTDLDENKAKAFAIADNRTAELAAWDNEILIESLNEIASMDDVELESTGFTDDDIELMSPSEKTDVEEDEVPEPPSDPVTKPGDIWQLGRHRVICGDCIDSKTFDNVRRHDRVDIAFTSPPYAEQREYDKESGFEPINHKNYVAWFDAVQRNIAAVLASDGSWFVNIKPHCEDGQRVLYVNDLLTAHIRQWGWKFIDEFAWIKSGVPGKWTNRFKNAWEPIFHFAKTTQVKVRHENVSYESYDIIEYSPDNTKTHSGFISGSAGERKKGKALPSNVLRICNHPSQTATNVAKHTATFPVQLPSFFVKAFSDEGSVIIDPFLGSGTTLIAAEQLGRTCYGIEISPAYCDVIVERWQNLTGEKAKRC